MANYASTRRGWGVPGSPGWEQSNLTSIQTPNGLMADVNDRMAPRFQGFVNDLASQGYNINSLGGYNNRNIAGSPYKSQHAYGNAIDINPTNNPVVYANSPFLSNGKQMITDLPPNISNTAAKWGMEWGGNWNNKKDPMHFEGTAVPVMPGVGTRAMYGNAADASDWEKERQATIWNNALNPAQQPSVLQNIASTVTAPFNAAQIALGNAYYSMFGASLPASSPQVASNPVPPADVGAVAPASQQPSSYAPFGTGPAGPLSTAPISGTVTASALPAAPTRMPARPVSQTPLIVGTQVADTPPVTTPSYAEGTLGHMLSRPQSAVMGSLAPSMSMTRTTAMPSSAPITAPTSQQAVDLSNRMRAMDAADLASRTAALKTALQTTPSSITAPAAFSMPSRPISPAPTAFAPTAPQVASTVPQAPQQQTGQWVSDLKAMDAAEGARRMAALSMPAQPVAPPQTSPVAPTPSLQAPSLSPSVPSVASAPTPTPSLPSLSPSAPAINGQTTTGLFASNAGLPGLSAMMQGNRPTLTPENFAASLQPPTVPGTNLPVGSPANPVNGPPVAPPSTLSKITPTLGDIKTGLVGAKIGMGAGPIGAAAGFAVPILGGIANRLGYGLNSPFFGGPTPNPGAPSATQSDVVAHAAPSVLAQVNRMGYGALPVGSDYHYGYSPFGSGISLVNNNDSEAHQIAATGPGLLGALGFGGPASAPSIAAQAAAARIAAANDAANTAAAAASNASQGNGNGSNTGSMNKGFGSNTNSNGRNGRNKNDNGNN